MIVSGLHVGFGDHMQFQEWIKADRKT